MNILHEMLMVVIAYSTKNEDHEVVEFLLAGFIGVLREWWENSLNDEELSLSKLVSKKQQESKMQYTY